MIAPIFQRDDVPVFGLTEDLQHFAAEDPIVPVQNARSRLYNQSRHGLH
jgi:hypothetical protein